MISTKNSSKCDKDRFGLNDGFTTFSWVCPATFFVAFLRENYPQMVDSRFAVLITLATALLVVGCVSAPHQLMPTPVVYQEPDGTQLFEQTGEERGSSTDVDLLYITDRRVETDLGSALPYGQMRAKSVAFGSARVRIGAGISWETLERESRRAERSVDLDLSLGRIEELGRYPEEPYEFDVRADGDIYLSTADARQHERIERLFREVLQRRLARSATKEVVLYVHGFDETFATAAFTTAELCHFLGREPVCAFFTWPASSTGNFLTSYITTTESAEYAIRHLKKTIRLLATTPGVERVQLLAHSRGAALLLSAAGALFTEAIAAGFEPSEAFNLGHMLLFAPDVDADVLRQHVAGNLSDPSMLSHWSHERMPRALHGQLTVYTSPKDRALLISRILFRSRSRAGELEVEDISLDSQRKLEPLEKIAFIVYEGKLTDTVGHSYFTTNPRVSSDIIQLLRYNKELGGPGRELVKVGPVVWEFPRTAD